MGKFPTSMEYEMSDAAMARLLVREIGGDCWDGKKAMLEHVYKVCVKANLPVTRRRIRAFWNGEAAKIEYGEMVGLARVAEAERRRREQLQEARKNHEQYIAESAALVERLAVQDEAFHREQIAGYREMARIEARISELRGEGKGRGMAPLGKRGG